MPRETGRKPPREAATCAAPMRFTTARRCSCGSSAAAGIDYGARARMSPATEDGVAPARVPADELFQLRLEPDVPHLVRAKDSLPSSFTANTSLWRRAARARV